MKYPTEVKAQASLLYVGGLSIREAAAHLGVSPGTVQYWLRSQGTPMRSKKQALAGYVPRPDAVERMRQNKRGKALAASHKQAISQALKGRPKSEQFVHHMRETRKGSANPNYSPHQFLEFKESL